MGDRVQPRCADCGMTLAAPSPAEYLELLEAVRERIVLSGAPGVRGEDVLRPYQDIVRASKDLHAANCPENLAAAAALEHVAVPGGAVEAAAGNGLARRLTAREEEVLGLVLAGASSREIADRLYISPHTVAFHVKGLMRKFGVHSKVALVAKAALQLQKGELPAVAAHDTPT